MKAMSLKESLFHAIIPAIMLYLATQLIIPILHNHFRIPLIYGWFLSSSVLIFLPMLIYAFIKLKAERPDNIWKRARLIKPSKSDACYIITGIFLTIISTYIIMTIMKSILPGFTTQVSFMQLEPIKGNYAILLAWIPMFILNIFGEAIYWRAYIFPRQEKAYRGNTYLIHFLCWLIFHLAFGWQLLIVLIPILLIIPIIVQKTQNSWSDIIIHSLINGSGFILIAFGII